MSSDVSPPNVEILVWLPSFFPLQPLHIYVYKRMGNEILSPFCYLHVLDPSYSLGYVRKLAVIAYNLYKKSRAAPTVRPVLRPRPCKINLMSK